MPMDSKKSRPMNPPRRGEVYWVNLDPVVGSEIAKRRPGVVISVNALNRQRNHVIIVPLSSKGTPRPPIVTAVTSLEKTATARVDQLRAVDKSRLQESMGTLSAVDMGEIEKGLSIVLGL